MKKKFFFKALVLVIEEQKKGLLAVTNFGDNPCLVWSDESTNRAYRLSFKDGLSHSRLYSNQPYNAGITIPFSLSWEETKFWQDVHSYFSDLEKKELIRLEQERLETERLAEMKRKEEIKKAEVEFFL